MKLIGSVKQTEEDKRILAARAAERRRQELLGNKNINVNPVPARPPRKYIPPRPLNVNEVHEKIEEAQKQKRVVAEMAAARRRVRDQPVFEREVFTADYLRYQILHRLGGGVYGEVYKVIIKENPAAGEYAMKIMKEVDDYEVFFLVYIKNQADSAKYVVTLYEAGKKRNTSEIFTVSELMDGDVAHFVEDPKNPFTGGEMHAIIYHLFRCLAYVHSLGIIHRDCHLGNFLFVKNKITGVYHIKITDFGLSCTQKTLRIYQRALESCASVAKFEERDETEFSDVYVLCRSLLYHASQRNHIRKLAKPLRDFLYDVIDTNKYKNKSNLAEFAANLAKNTKPN